MKQGESVEILVKGERKRGKVVKVYTQIGFENHGKEVAVILLEDSSLTFCEGEIQIMNFKDGADGGAWTLTPYGQRILSP